MIGEIRFPSKMEARVFQSLSANLQPGEQLYRQVRFPLLAVSPGKNQVPLYITIDFVVVGVGGTWRAIDAKSGRKSREWDRGKAAFEATYGIPLNEQS